MKILCMPFEKHLTWQNLKGNLKTKSNQTKSEIGIKSEMGGGGGGGGGGVS